MRITSDWHIHSRNSCDEASLAVVDLVEQAKTKGIVDFGLTDHVHTSYNLPDLERSRAEFDASGPSSHFHFGVEVSCVSQWEIEQIAKGYVRNPTYGIRRGGPANGALAIGIHAQDVGKYGLEYVVGGTHWPMYVPLEREAIIRDYHRQNMFLVTHPLVDIVAHPWWWHGHWRDPSGKYAREPWFDDFDRIPRAMHEEFGAAAIELLKKVEINVCAMLLNPHYPEGFKRQYLAYLADLKARGVQLCVGSDCHDARYEIDFGSTYEMLKSVSITEADLWTLAPRA